MLHISEIAFVAKLKIHKSAIKRGTLERVGNPSRITQIGCSGVAQAIVITGLRRSGTTVFWETFRHDHRSVCFDEPFHPDLWRGRRSNAKGTWTELSEVWQREQIAERTDLKPIPPVEELDTGSSAAQRAYLRTLMLQGRASGLPQSDRSVIDTVRCWNRLPEILPGDVGTLVVHLLRDPASWVTSIMLPTGDRSSPGKFAQVLRRACFFWTRNVNNKWRYGEIIDAAIARRHAIWNPLPISPDELALQPAVAKLLAFWLAANLETHRRLSGWHGGQAITVSLAEFASDPGGTIARIYAAAGWPLLREGLGYDHVRSYRAAWRGSSAHWRRAFACVGLRAEFLEDPAMKGRRMAELFSQY